mmetsp:Transcript_4447/g.16782  ORF Transcript_4447/g.16782 Transcript_4447/m.16782 type:complete len:110 (-) Transcript_4447:139-468(-)|eukprot:CAMPEP_0117448144 /NCGR_PEP_ID=MMETSP0759-20121206/7246_1 /TAXON_ID=63605 /ORGANISM="Percolomonas cosmopolitus, Strain WS" /LENGTH=109 /DNA_ID=CAMNT_0005240515 /DNA_START=884 /DNA_END=1213 /DNA_ORIENTATION=-
MPHYIVTKVKKVDAPDYIFTEKKDISEPYVVYSDVLKLVADKLGANTEKLSIEDKGVYFTDECPGSDFQFNLKNNEDDVVYSVKVEGNRKEKNVDKTSGGVYVKGPKRK